MATSITAPKCPACARSLYFSHNDINLIVCVCGAVVHRVEDGVIIRQFNAIKEPAAIIQPGTEGVWNDIAFKVTGRFRAWMNEAVFNYWTVIFADGRTCYLAEGYGLYAIYEKMQVERHLSSAFLDGLSVGADRDLFTGVPYLLENEQRVSKWELEGEIYLPVPPSRMRIFEFGAANRSRVEVMEFAKDKVFTFNVSYVSFASLALANTRNWQPFEKTITCKSCSTSAALKAFPYSQSYACQHCGKQYALDGDEQFTLQRNHDRVDIAGSITLGASATMKGIAYEVVGYAFKEEANIDQAQWKEYALFNPQEGFAFLSEFQGNWIYLREQGQVPILKRERATEFWQGKILFELFNRYKFKIINAAGEFPYNIFNDKEKSASEFIAPPKIWIQERSKDEGIKWFLGEHISRKELEAAFAEAIIMPSKIGIGATEPTGYLAPEKLSIATMVALLFLVLAHVFTTVPKERRVLLDTGYAFDSLHTVSHVSGKFGLEKWRSNLRFDIEAPVDNSWFEFSCSLVNVATGTEYSLEKGVEYYHGYTDGESWTEGSTRESAYLTDIPSGTYYLQFSGTREDISWGYPGKANIEAFYVTVTYDVPQNRNLLICIIALLIVSFIQYQVTQYYEKARWSNSPFSPYNQDNES